MKAQNDELLTSSQLAIKLGVDRKTAWSWIRELERKFGERCIVRRGNRRMVTMSSITQVACPAMANVRGLGSVSTDVESLSARVDELENTVARLVASMAKCK